MVRSFFDLEPLKGELSALPFSFTLYRVVSLDVVRNYFREDGSLIDGFVDLKYLVTSQFGDNRSYLI